MSADRRVWEIVVKGKAIVDKNVPYCLKILPRRLTGPNTAVKMRYVDQVRLSIVDDNRHSKFYKFDSPSTRQRFSQ
jgi:hypothetical protein